MSESEYSRNIKGSYDFQPQYVKEAASIWKRALMISCESVWCTIIIAGSVFSVLESLYRSIRSACYERDVPLFIVIDVIFGIDIVLYLSCLCVPKLNIPEVNLGFRSKLTVIFEIISLLPVHLIIPTETQRERNVYCVFRVTRSLKVVRVFSFISSTGKYLTKPGLVVAIQLLFTAFFVTTLTQALYYNCRLLIYEIKIGPYDASVLFENITLNLISGGKSDVPGDVTWELFMLIGVIVSLYFANARMAAFVVGAVNGYTQRVEFRQRYSTAMQRFLSYGNMSWLVNNTNDIFEEFWKQRGGYESTTDCLKILPPTIGSFIQCNIAYPAFIHSRMFRRMNYVFLRHISQAIEVRYYFPGEYVYRLNQHKNKMMYLVRGVIQVLSDVDGITPLFQFTSGTCIGDSTLFTSYKSTTVVQCKTYCEFYVLKMKHFQRELSKFTQEQTFMRKLVRKRYRNAMELKSLWENHDGNSKDRQSRYVSTSWLKNTLHRLMSSNKNSVLQHEFQNIHLVNEFKLKYFDMKIFTALYLDTLAIDDRLSTHKERLFIKRTFPMLIQPNSIGAYIWEGVVMTFTILLLIAMPYTAFVLEKMSSWYMPLKNIATAIFWFDILVILSTSIKNRSGYCYNYKDNVIARFQTVSFWLAVIASFPMEIFTPIFLFKLNNKSIVLMHVNRLLKIIRLVRYVTDQQKNYKSNLLLSWLLILTLTRFYWIYLLYFIMSYYCDDTLKVNPIEIFVNAFFYASSVPGITSPDHWIFIISKYVIVGLWVWITSGICASIILYEKNILDVQEISFQLMQLVSEHKLNLTYDRLQNYLTAQFLDNATLHFYDSKFNIYYSKHFKGDVICSLVLDNIEKATCLSIFDEDVLLEISRNAHIRLYPSDEIIIQAGDVADAIYILKEGSCDVFHRDGDFMKYIDVPSELNLIENIFKTPSIHTVICRANCVVIIILKSDFLSILKRKWDKWLEINEIINNSNDIKSGLYNLGEFNHQEIRIKSMLINITKPWSFKVFRNVNVIGSFEEYDYYHPFDSLLMFSFIRFFLMKVTFHPEGKFLYFWESQRIFFAVLSCLGSFCVPILKSKSKFYLIFLDVTALIDVYVRLHVGYYQENGVLVTHPLKTSVHYITHGLLIDLLGILPVRYFYKYSVITEVFFNSSRLLQLHRYIQFLNYCKNDILKPTNRKTTILYIPLILILTNILACTLFLLECNITENENNYLTNNLTLIGFKCNDHSLLASSHYKNKITLFDAHWYLLWVLTSLMTDRHFIGYSIKSTHSFMVLALVKVFSLYINVMIFCRIFTYFSFRDTDLIETQISMQHLKRWLNQTVRSPKLTKTMIDTQKLRWERRNHMRMSKFVAPFNPVLKADVLEEYFSKFFYNEKSLFGKDFKKFYRSMLKHVSIDVVIKKGFLQTINDIDDELYILLDGMGEVIAADGTKLASLGNSSLYGNLTDEDFTRLKVSVIAVTNVQILKVKTKIWNQKIMFYPDLEKEYKKYRNRCLFYIKMNPEEAFLKKLKRMKEISSATVPLMMGTTSINTRLSNIIAKTYLFFPCYIGVLTDMYQLTVMDFSTWVYSIQCFCDVAFAVEIIMLDRTSVLNKYGFKIRDLTAIRKKNRKNTFSNWIRLFTVWPFDLIVFHIPTARYPTMIIFLILRFPKLLRIFLFNDYLLKIRTGFLPNLFWYRMVHIFGWLITFLQCCVFMMSFMCYMEVNINVHVPSCREIFDLPPNKKFSLYIRYMFILVKTYAQMLQYLYYPICANTYVMFTIMMLVMNYLFCVLSARTFSTFYEWFVIKCRYFHLYDHLHKFLNYENASVAIKDQALNYVKTFWFIHQGEYFPNLVKNATPYLKDALYNHAYAFLLYKSDVFGSCHEDFLRQVVQKLDSRVYLGGQFIQYAGAIDSCMYFLYHGQVTVLDDNKIGKDANIIWLKKGASFGIEAGLLRGTRHKYSYRCVIRCVILSLCLNDWEYLLEYFPASKEFIYTTIKSYNGV
ncbi:uncharacterized protein [Onthophagus taurus]|uniref:uncharacterized protein n=1 Tax=Onthophagus taurus TaxID=166361 RepID=UPI0039BDDB98